jgi:C_GCAxxG_C_C family probable redox protein
VVRLAIIVKVFRVLEMFPDGDVKVMQVDAVCQKAVGYFLGNYNCAQSILLAMFEYWNGKSDLVPKIATAFGGGIGRCGSVCGAVTGCIMAIGVRFGTNEPSPAKRIKAYELAQRFYQQFEKQNGSVLCRDLIGYDLSDPKGLEKAREAKVFEEKCSFFIKDAVAILLELTSSSH